MNPITEACASVKDGGASDGLLAHFVSGFSVRVNLRVVRPALIVSIGNQARVWSLPFTVKLCTYEFSIGACCATIRICRPLTTKSGFTSLGDLVSPNLIVMAAKLGLLMTKPPTPGSAGYRPIELQMYQAEVAPRSSLPGSPAGVTLKVSVMMRRTTFCVRAGAPAKVYV